MNCTHCGQPLQGDEKFCPWCGQQAPTQANQVYNPYAQNTQGYQQPYQNQAPYYAQPPQQPYTVYPQNHADWVKSSGLMGWAIACIFLFWPLAIPAIIYAGKIDPQNRIGNFTMARYYANRSKLFSTIASCVGGGFLILSWIIPLMVSIFEILS